MDLEEIKRYDDSVWLHILKETTVFDTVNIKAQKDWLIKSVESYEEAMKPKPIEEWHEDDGDVIWWKLPINEPPYIGSPLCDDFTFDYYTHFTRLLEPLEIEE